ERRNELQKQENR
nr:Chain C, Ribonuclease Y [Bacillus subtilis]6F7T_D Chain D, Ribonuclease Y [Bacillus subtilis]